MVTSRFHVKPTCERPNLGNEDAGGRRRPGYEASPSCSIISSLLAAASAAVSLIWANLSAVRASSRRLLTFCTRSSCFLERQHFTNVVTQHVGAQLWLPVSALTRRGESYLMSSSVTTNALQSGCVVLSHTPGFFSTAAVSWPVTGAGLVCRALAMAERSVLSELEGPTPAHSKGGARNSSSVPPDGFPTHRGAALPGYPPWRPFGRSMDFISSSAMSNAFSPLSFRSQNSCRSKRHKSQCPRTVGAGGSPPCLTCRGWSIAFCGSVFTLLLGWLVTLVTGCLKIDAVCRTGSVVFKSGLALRTDGNTQRGHTRSNYIDVFCFLNAGSLVSGGLTRI